MKTPAEVAFDEWCGTYAGPEKVHVDCAKVGWHAAVAWARHIVETEEELSTLICRATVRATKRSILNRLG